MNILTKYLRHIIKQIVVGFFIVFSVLTFAQAQEELSPENNLAAGSQAFISDDLTIFMHAGPGTNYRILGTITAGSKIEITGKSDKGYSEIKDDKNRITWVDSKYITTKPGLRFVVANVNEKLARANDYNAQLDGEINELKSNIAVSNQDRKALTTELEKVKKQLKETQSKVSTQDTKMLSQRFYNGAIVLGVGLFFGLILPRFFSRRRSSMDSWS